MFLFHIVWILWLNFIFLSLQFVYNIIFFPSLLKVRAAAITCFAGLTSPVFFSLQKEDQDFILSSCVRFFMESFCLLHYPMYIGLHIMITFETFPAECSCEWWYPFCKVSCLSCHWSHFMFSTSNSQVLFLLVSLLFMKNTITEI